MSNGNEGIQPLLRLMRGKLADHRSKTNAEIDAMSQALDDYERREVKEIKVDAGAQVKQPVAPVADDTVIEAADVIPGLQGKPDRE